MKALPSRSQTQRRLELRLRQLQQILNYGHGLSVKWRPGRARCSRNLAGEIVGESIFIYDNGEDAALQTLTHEIIEHYIVDYERHYVTLVNSLVEAFNQIQRRRRHGLVERLSKLVDHLGGD